MEAIRTKGKNIDDIVEYLIEKEMVHEQVANPSVTRERTLESDKPTLSMEDVKPENEPLRSVVPNHSPFGFDEELNPWAGFSQDDINRKPVAHNFESVDPFKRK